MIPEKNTSIINPHVHVASCKQDSKAMRKPRHKSPSLYGEPGLRQSSMGSLVYFLSEHQKSRFAAPEKDYSRHKKNKNQVLLLEAKNPSRSHFLVRILNSSKRIGKNKFSTGNTAISTGNTKLSSLSRRKEYVLRSANPLRRLHVWCHARHTPRANKVTEGRSDRRCPSGPKEGQNKPAER